VYAEIPDDAYMNADQLLYLSDVSVHVVAVAPDGVEAQETGAARVRLAWDTDMTPLLMDVETAESEAPGDAWDPTAPALTGIATLEELRQ
jgi:hypothetical protein